MKFKAKELNEKSFTPFKIEITFENKREYNAIKSVLGKFRNDLLTQDEHFTSNVSQENIDIFCDEIDFMYQLYDVVTSKEFLY